MSSNDEEAQAQKLAATWQQLSRHVSPITGVVTSLTRREDSAEQGSHNYLAGHYFPTLRADARALMAGQVARSGGKGASDIEARVVAVCESIERYSGVYWGDEAILQASQKELGDSAIRLQSLCLYSERQYAERAQSNPHVLNDRELVPNPLADDEVIGWTKAWSLTRSEERWVPAAYCFYGYRDGDSFYCGADSNGCAAGPTLEDAIRSGLLELIERDSVAIWWYNRLNRPAVDGESFALDYWGEMCAHYARNLNRDLHVLDLTADLDVPVFRRDIEAEQSPR